METETTSNDKMVRQHRKVIEDKLITEEILGKIIAKVYATVSNPYDIGQQDIVSACIPLKLSNATIARVINEMIPNSKATVGSIASLIRFMNNKKKLLDELLIELEKDL